MIRVTVWNEGLQEQRDPAIAKIYPEGIHGALASGLRGHGIEVRTATFSEREYGLSERVLAETDVLTWWGHVAHQRVSDAVVERVQRRVLDGMGLIVLHSGHHSKLFKRLMGTSCDLKWRESNDKERLWVVEPGHPIAEGLDETIEIEHDEMYGERFDIPQPDAVVFISWFSGGEVFRSGCCFTRGRGRIFYFRPGHETYPVYYQPQVIRVIANAARWAAPTSGPTPFFGNVKALE